MIFVLYVTIISCCPHTERNIRHTNCSTDPRCFDFVVALLHLRNAWYPICGLSSLCDSALFSIFTDFCTCLRTLLKLEVYSVRLEVLSQYTSHSKMEVYGVLSPLYFFPSFLTARLHSAMSLLHSCLCDCIWAFEAANWATEWVYVALVWGPACI